MLLRLGRWLRAAGHDCADPAPGAGDRAVLAQALREDRLLATRDCKLTEFREAPGRVVLLRANGVNACAAELTSRLAIDWLRAPFSRCLVCNRPLQAADPALWPFAGRLDLAAVAPLTHCGHCDRLYWQGGHARRMRAVLERWARGEFGC